MEHESGPPIIVDQLEFHFDNALLTVRLSGHEVMINGNALSPPLSFVAAIPVTAVQEGRGATSKRARTTDVCHRA
jgi:hypothetical protein